MCTRLKYRAEADVFNDSVTELYDFAIEEFTEPGKPMKADEARLHLEAAENFVDIAQVKAEGREENLRWAIEAYKKALGYFTIEKSKSEFARIQNNLGNAYGSLSEVRDKEKNLQRAVNAFQEALKIYTLNDFPVQYAATKANLGKRSWVREK